ncbi:TerD family protein [Nocardia abscessus]|uniref:TerD family protein n=1 Tax=Nocardia abscessus TaxID=120957 RepID=UPI00245679EA|nr:TerD family protein [Nocardia abscessus]
MSIEVCRPTSRELKVQVEARLLVDGKLRSEDDTVSPTHRETANGALRHTDRSKTDSKVTDTFTCDWTRLDSQVNAIEIAANVTGAARARDAVKALEVKMSAAGKQWMFELDGLTGNRAVVLAKIYRHGDHIKLRALGRGCHTAPNGRAKSGRR